MYNSMDSYLAVFKVAHTKWYLAKATSLRRTFSHVVHMQASRLTQ